MPAFLTKYHAKLLSVGFFLYRLRRKHRYDVKCTVRILKAFKICKGKAIPLQAWTGPEGSRRVRLPDFKTIDT